MTWRWRTARGLVGHQGGSMLVEGGGVKRLREHVGGVLAGLAVLDDDVALSHELAHLEVSALDVTRSLARLQVLGERDGAQVVDVKDGGLGHVLTHLAEQPAEVEDL